MKKILIALLLTVSTAAFAQNEPIVTFEGGDLYFVPSKLTSKGVAFMYSHKEDWETCVNWFTIFDDELNIVKQAEIAPETINYTTRTITTQRRYFYRGTRAAGDSENEYFLDDWNVTSDITEDHSLYNSTIRCFEVYEDNNNYHSRYMYVSQTLFDNDEDFEFLRSHYEVMPLTYCQSDEEGGISISLPTFGGETCDDYTIEYDYELGGNVVTLKRYKVYGGLKETGLDVVSLNGTIKKTLDGITDLGTVVAINGNYYVSAYDWKTGKYGLYKIATATTNLSKVSDISGETKAKATYNLAGVRINADTKGIVIRNGQKVFNK